MQRPALPGEFSADAAGTAPRPAARAARRRVWRLALSLGLLLPPVALLLGFLAFLDMAAATPDAPLRRTDGIVVLTGGGERVRTGLTLLLDDPAARLLVSGAHPDVTLADLAASAGVPAGPLQARVTLGRTARSTRGNAVETAAWVRTEDIRSMRLVTAGYHMPRATLEIRRLLPPGVEVVPHPVQPPGLRESDAGGRARTWTLFLGEYAKLIGAWLGLSRPAGAAP